jgi:hypothetical protein
MVMPDSGGIERRQARRYPAAELRARMRVKKGLLSESWEEVAATDFSRTGVAIELGMDLGAGDPVVLALDLHMEMGVISIEKLVGVVRYRKMLGKLTRYGIEFDLTQRVKGADLETQLSRIEGLLERSHNLAQRIIDQSQRH